MSSEKDKRFMSELPYEVKGQIFLNYLFTDFLKIYENYFKI